MLTGMNNCRPLCLSVKTGMRENAQIFRVLCDFLDGVESVRILLFGGQMCIMKRVINAADSLMPQNSIFAVMSEHKFRKFQLKRGHIAFDFILLFV